MVENRRLVSYWENKKRHTLPVEVPLHRENREIVQELRGQILLLKDKLPSEEDRLGMTCVDLFTQLQGGCHNLRPDPMDSLGMESMVLHIVDIPAGLPVHRGTQVADLLASFEVPRIDNADFGKDKVREHSRKHPLDAQKRVDA